MSFSSKVAVPLALLSLAGCGAPDALPAGSRVGIMSALPLFGTSAPMGDVINGPDQRAAIVRSLAERFDLRPIDHLTPEALKGETILILAQPRLLAPEELVALDSWVRDGGRALIFTDPALVWPSDLPLGDRRRPPPIGLLDPLLKHWGLALGNPEAGDDLVKVPIGGRATALAKPGRWASASMLCAVADERLVADCRIGKGRALLVADADLLDERLWEETGIDNRATAHALIQRVAGPPTAKNSVSIPGKGGT